LTFSRTFRTVFLSALLLLAVCASAPGAEGGQAQIGRTIWGFGNAVQPGRTNLLSIEVLNSGPLPLECELSLEPRMDRSAYVEPLYLGPNQARWVQIPVYVENEGEAFSATIRVRDKAFGQTLQTPKAGPPAVVQLRQRGVFGRNSGLPGFDEELFPPSAALCDGLAGVVLDRLPGRWGVGRGQIGRAHV
jgi:hypothetical protein